MGPLLHTWWFGVQGLGVGGQDLGGMEALCAAIASSQVKVGA